MRSDFASFIDGFIAGIRREWDVPGMVFIAVMDDEILYKIGYGHIDAEGTAEVSADATLFRVGEISELFTAAAVLQLAEKGRIAIDDDVNTYLRRNRLPNTFEQPVTIRSLLTHTAGLDGKTFEVCAPGAAEERGFANRLNRAIPARYAPPGRSYAHSTMGYALLGSIVERYSRQSFSSAVKRHVFTPLGMSSSTFMPTEEEMARLANAYAPDGSLVSYAYRYDAAAMSMSTTASDMGRFMMAVLNGGKLGRGRILSDPYTRSIFRTHFTPDPAIDGTGLGCLERHVEGVRTIQSSGSMPGWSSFMMLIPERRFGLFYAANASGIDLSEDLARTVVSRFFPHAGPDGGPQILTGVPAARDVAGHYRTNSISRCTAEKALRMFDDQIIVTSDGRALTLTHTRADIPPQRWLPAGSDASLKSTDLYREVDEHGAPMQQCLFFQRHDDGSVASLVIGGVSATYDRLSRVDEHGVQTALIIIFLSVPIFSLLGVAICVTVNKGKMQWEKGYRGTTELWTISSLFCGIQALFAVGLWASYRMMGEGFYVFVPYQVKALFVIPFAGTLLLAWLCFRIVTNMIDPESHWAEKVLLCCTAACEIAYICFLHHWRLLGFMF